MEPSTENTETVEAAAGGAVYKTNKKNAAKAASLKAELEKQYEFLKENQLDQRRALRIMRKIAGKPVPGASPINCRALRRQVRRNIKDLDLYLWWVNRDMNYPVPLPAHLEASIDRQLPDPREEVAVSPI